MKALFYLRSYLPVLALEKISKIPGLMDPKKAKQIAELKFVYSKINEMYDLFQHFSGNEWIYETKKIVEYDAVLTPEDRKTFYVNTKDFEWRLGI